MLIGGKWKMMNYSWDGPKTWTGPLQKWMPYYRFGFCIRFD